MRPSRLRIALAATALTLGLTACQTTPTLTGQAYAAYEARLIAEGDLRTDREPADAPFTAADLALNFSRIAFGLEADINEGRTRTEMTRWEEPIRWNLFVPPSEAKKARADVLATFARIRAATGLTIFEEPDDTRSNFDILILDEESYADRVAWAETNTDEGDADLISRFRSEISSPCRAKTYQSSSPRDGLPAGATGYGLVLIRAGYSDIFRLSCVEEEIVQAMGLTNDDDRVRPSIFNDDEEFAYLTTHDELLLRILYDPRLKPGMTEDEAMPIVRQIAAELVPAEGDT
ncbi:MAG: DUF2927 domain-containing protein [Pseudomonadota bacterium]